MRTRHRGSDTCRVASGVPLPPGTSRSPSVNRADEHVAPRAAACRGRATVGTARGPAPGSARVAPRHGARIIRRSPRHTTQCGRQEEMGGASVTGWREQQTGSGARNKGQAGTPRGGSGWKSEGREIASGAKGPCKGPGADGAPGGGGGGAHRSLACCRWKWSSCSSHVLKCSASFSRCSISSSCSRMAFSRSRSSRSCFTCRRMGRAGCCRRAWPGVLWGLPCTL